MTSEWDRAGQQRCAEQKMYWSPSHQACRTQQDCDNSGGEFSADGRCEGYGYKLNAGTYALYNQPGNCEEGKRPFRGNCVTPKEFCRARGKWWYKDRCNNRPDPDQTIGGGGDWTLEKQACLTQNRVWYSNTCMSKPQYCRASGNNRWDNGKCVAMDKPVTEPKSTFQRNCEAGGNYYWDDNGKSNERCLTPGEFCRVRGKYWYDGKCRENPPKDDKKSSETTAANCEYVPAWYINTGNGWECPDGWKWTGVDWSNAGRYDGLTGKEQCARTDECVRALKDRKRPPAPPQQAPSAPVGVLASSTLINDML